MRPKKAKPDPLTPAARLFREAAIALAFCGEWGSRQEKKIRVPWLTTRLRMSATGGDQTVAPS